MIYLSLLSKVNANSWDELWIELVVGVLIEEACLADNRVAQGKKLDQIVVVREVGVGLAVLYHGTV